MYGSFTLPLSGCRKRLPALFACCILAIALPAQTLVIGISQGNSEPYAIIRGGELAGGIIKEIGDAMARELGIMVAYQTGYAKGRLEQATREGKVHIMPIYNPDWVSAPGDFQWSDPLFVERNVLVGSVGTFAGVHRFADLRGKRVGTILGYVYPTIEASFQKGGVIREDVAGLDQNFLKLQNGRIDALIDSDILVAWRLKNAFPGFGLADFEISRQTIRFGYAKSLPIDGSRINACLRKLKDTGQIDRILARYR